MGNQEKEEMRRSMLIDFRSDTPIEAHPQVRVFLDQGWMLCGLKMKSLRRPGESAGVPRVLIRLVKKADRSGVASARRSKLPELSRP